VIKSASRETVLLYWDIGQGIAEKQAKAGWGEAVVEKLSRDLIRAFPGALGFSAQNLWRMRQFYLEHSSREFLSHAVRELGIKGEGEKLSQAVREFLAGVPWGHHNLLNEKEKAPDDAPSIGIILCAEKDEIDVEFALKSKTNPIGVAAYQLQPTLPAELKGRIPSARQLADAVREHLPARK
jgi:hypothetical protein